MTQLTHNASQPTFNNPAPILLNPQERPQIELTPDAPSKKEKNKPVNDLNPVETAITKLQQEFETVQTKILTSPERLQEIDSRILQLYKDYRFQEAQELFQGKKAYPATLFITILAAYRRNDLSYVLTAAKQIIESLSQDYYETVARVIISGAFLRASPLLQGPLLLLGLSHYRLSKYYQDQRDTDQQKVHLDAAQLIEEQLRLFSFNDRIILKTTKDAFLKYQNPTFQKKIKTPKTLLPLLDKTPQESIYEMEKHIHSSIKVLLTNETFQKNFSKEYYALYDNGEYHKIEEKIRTACIKAKGSFKIRHCSIEQGALYLLTLYKLGKFKLGLRLSRQLLFLDQLMPYYSEQNPPNPKGLAIIFIEEITIAIHYKLSQEHKKFHAIAGHTLREQYFLYNDILNQMDEPSTEKLVRENFKKTLQLFNSYKNHINNQIYKNEEERIPLLHAYLNKCEKKFLSSLTHQSEHTELAKLYQNKQYTEIQKYLLDKEENAGSVKRFELLIFLLSEYRTKNFKNVISKMLSSSILDICSQYHKDVSTKLKSQILLFSSDDIKLLVALLSVSHFQLSQQYHRSNNHNKKTYYIRASKFMAAQLPLHFSIITNFQDMKKMLASAQDAFGKYNELPHKDNILKNRIEATTGMEKTLENLHPKMEKFERSLLTGLAHKKELDSEYYHLYTGGEYEKLSATLQKNCFQTTEDFSTWLCGSENFSLLLLSEYKQKKFVNALNISNGMLKGTLDKYYTSQEKQLPENKLTLKSSDVALLEIISIASHYQLHKEYSKSKTDLVLANFHLKAWEKLGNQFSLTEKIIEKFSNLSTLYGMQEPFNEAYKAYQEYQELLGELDFHLKKNDFVKTLTPEKRKFLQISNFVFNHNDGRNYIEQYIDSDVHMIETLYATKAHIDFFKHLKSLYKKNRFEETIKFIKTDTPTTLSKLQMQMQKFIYAFALCKLKKYQEALVAIDDLESTERLIAAIFLQEEQSSPATFLMRIAATGAYLPDLPTMTQDEYTFINWIKNPKNHHKCQQSVNDFYSGAEYKKILSILDGRQQHISYSSEIKNFYIYIFNLFKKRHMVDAFNYIEKNSPKNLKEEDLHFIRFLSIHALLAISEYKKAIELLHASKNDVFFQEARERQLCVAQIKLYEYPLLSLAKQQTHEVHPEQMQEKPMEPVSNFGILFVSFFLNLNFGSKIGLGAFVMLAVYKLYLWYTYSFELEKTDLNKKIEDIIVEIKDFNEEKDSPYLKAEQKNNFNTRINTLEKSIATIQNKLKNLTADKKNELPDIKNAFSETEKDTHELILEREKTILLGQKDKQKNLLDRLDSIQETINAIKNKSPLARSFVLETEKKRILDTQILSIKTQKENEESIKYFESDTLEILSFEKSHTKLLETLPNIQDKIFRQKSTGAVPSAITNFDLKKEITLIKTLTFSEKEMLSQKWQEIKILEKTIEGVPAWREKTKLIELKRKEIIILLNDLIERAKKLPKKIMAPENAKNNTLTNINDNQMIVRKFILNQPVINTLTEAKTLDQIIKDQLEPAETAIAFLEKIVLKAGEKKKENVVQQREQPIEIYTEAFPEKPTIETSMEFMENPTPITETEPHIFALETGYKLQENKEYHKEGDDLFLLSCIFKQIKAIHGDIGEYPEFVNAIKANMTDNNIANIQPEDVRLAPLSIEIKSWLSKKLDKVFALSWDVVLKIDKGNKTVSLDTKILNASSQTSDGTNIPIYLAFNEIDNQYHSIIFTKIEPKSDPAPKIKPVLIEKSPFILPDPIMQEPAAEWLQSIEHIFKTGDAITQAKSLLKFANNTWLSHHLLHYLAVQAISLMDQNNKHIKTVRDYLSHGGFLASESLLKEIIVSLSDLFLAQLKYSSVFISQTWYQTIVDFNKDNMAFDKEKHIYYISALKDKKHKGFLDTLFTSQINLINLLSTITKTELSEKIRAHLLEMCISTIGEFGPYFSEQRQKLINSEAKTKFKFDTLPAHLKNTFLQMPFLKACKKIFKNSLMHESETGDLSREATILLKEFSQQTSTLNSLVHFSSLFTSGPEPMQKILKATLNNNPIEFEVQEVLGDGNCGITAMGIKNRDEFCATLREILSNQDSPACTKLFDIIYREILSSVKTPQKARGIEADLSYLPSELLKNLEASLGINYDENAFKETYTKYINSILKCYMDNLGTDRTWINRELAIPYAQAKDFNLYIMASNGALLDSYETKTGKDKKYVEYTGNHFNLLILKEKTESVKKISPKNKSCGPLG